MKIKVRQAVSDYNRLDSGLDSLEIHGSLLRKEYVKVSLRNIAENRGQN